MKTTTTKYDYPTQTIGTYKVYKQNKQKDINIQQKKIKCYEYNKQQRQIERMKIKEQKQKKQCIERKNYKNKIYHQIQKKKYQLQQLQNINIKQEKLSYQRALLKQQQQKIHKIQQQKKFKIYQQNAQNRFINALKKLESEKQIYNRKQKQAIQRRKVAEQIQKIQRHKAAKFRSENFQKQKVNQELKKSFKDYKQQFGKTTFSKTIDYTKTFLHNPSIIPNKNAPQTTSLQQNAIQQAQKYNNRQKERSAEKKVKEQQNKKITQERGKKALEKVVLQKQYRQYVKQQQQKGKVYNLQRLQAGKKNQYAGLKPTTLHQMEANKKLRGEQEFQKMFFGGQNPQWFDKPANRYNVLQNKFNDTIQNSQNSGNNQLDNVKNSGTLISDSHYSFESEGIDKLTSVKKKQNDELQKHEQKKRAVQLPEQVSSQINHQDGTQRKREQLNYSQSQDQQA